MLQRFFTDGYSRQIISSWQCCLQDMQHFWLISANPHRSGFKVSFEQLFSSTQVLIPVLLSISSTVPRIIVIDMNILIQTNHFLNYLTNQRFTKWYKLFLPIVNWTTSIDVNNFDKRIPFISMSLIGSTFIECKCN